VFPVRKHGRGLRPARLCNNQEPGATVAPGFHIPTEKEIMLPTEQELIAKPFDTFKAGEGRVIWYDRDLELFMVGDEEPDGADSAEEFDTFQEAVEYLTGNLADQ